MPVLYSISRRDIGGYSEVHVRFYNGRACDLRARTRIFVPVGCWNTEEGRCNISRRYETPENIKARNAQAKLDDLAQRIIDAYADAGGRVSREWLQKVIDNDTEELPLAETIEHYCDVKNAAPSSRRKLRSLGMHIIRFEKKAHKRLYAHSITRDDLDAFLHHLRSTGTLGQNAIASRLRQLRALVYFGGRPYPNPFEDYKMPQEVYGDPIFLTAEERDEIAACEALSKTQRIQRDIFVFQCYTGCRVSDLYALRYDNIRDGWLVYQPKKTARETGRTVELPLAPIALALVERYKGVDLRGRLFPFVNEVQYNSDIKEILCAAGITRTVMWRDPISGEAYPRPLFSVASSHLARRTFTQILYERTGDKRLVASMTGHDENSRAFNRYSGITREMKRRALGVEKSPRPHDAGLSKI